MKELKNVTPWFSGNTHPCREGWYEREFKDGIYSHYWNMTQCYGFWSSTINGEPHWRQVGDYPKWRGLKMPYKISKIDHLMLLADDYKESISAGMKKETRNDLKVTLLELIESNCKGN